MRASDVFVELAQRISPQSALLFTSGNTGNPALGEINAGLVPNLVSLTYLDGRDLIQASQQAESASSRTLVAVSDRVRAGGTYDLAFVDPFHSYVSSIEALTLALECTPTGWIVVHDCLPTFAIASDDETDGEWSGSTYAAFYDLMRSETTNRAWFVVDSDFGIGVIGPEGSGYAIQDAAIDDEIEAWRSSNLEQKRKFLLKDATKLFRAIHAVALSEVLDCVLNDKGPFALPNLAARLKGQIRDLELEIIELEVKAQTLSDELVAERQTLKDLRASKSWRLTRPCRAIGRVCRNIFRPPAH